MAANLVILSVAQQALVGGADDEAHMAPPQLAFNERHAPAPRHSPDGGRLAPAGREQSDRLDQLSVRPIVDCVGQGDAIYAWLVIQAGYVSALASQVGALDGGSLLSGEDAHH